MKYIGTALIIVCAVIVIAAPAEAGTRQLGIALDASGSIQQSGWNTITTALNNALNTVIPLDGSIELTVVQFSTGASVLKGPTVINNAADLASVTAAISAYTYVGGWTYMGDGIELLTGQVQSSAIYDPGNTIIYNIFSDGVPEYPTGSAAAQADAIAERNNAIAAGVDEIDAEFLGSVGSGGYTFLAGNIVYPQPVSAPYNPGFIVAVDLTTVQAAFESKLAAITNVVPVPMAAWLGLAMLGSLGAFRQIRRRRRAA